MADRPILFSGPMIRANRAGIKTNTRRAFNLPKWAEPGTLEIDDDGPYAIASVSGCLAKVPTPINVGDRLWVREEFSGPYHFKPKVNPPATWPVDCDVWYWADGNPDHADWTKPKRAMHMPRWMSRLTLVVTGVKVERLQDISREDAIAEGLEWVAPTYGISGIASTWNGDARESYFALWDHINGTGAAAKNPWVVAYAYTVRHCNIDLVAKEAA
ncbi:hypothetical protein GOC88_16575 [Sinorhizobium medicae]|nr:hypothetical protein [Sinorhizobium medicae]